MSGKPQPPLPVKSVERNEVQAAEVRQLSARKSRPAAPRGHKPFVALAYVHDADVSYNWYRGVLAMVSYDQSHNRHVVDSEIIDVKYSSGGLPEARNIGVKRFLQSSSEWLFWLDTDMGFRANTVDLLLEVADPVHRPVVGALCFAYQHLFDSGEQQAYEAHLRRYPVPTIYDWTADFEGEQGFIPLSPYPVNALVRCAGTGSACILIHRSVFEKLPYGQWYDRLPRQLKDGSMGWYGEDLSFCVRLGAVGIPLYVDTTVKTTHRKDVHVGEQDYWETYVAPPADQEVAVLVPVMQRPEKAEIFMRSLRASTGMAHAYAICDRDDLETIAAWEKMGATVVIVNDYRELDRPGRFSEKVNVGYMVSSEPWVFIVGDDVLFYPGWLDQAEMLTGEDRYHVIGTNDLGNPSVMNGDHATHILISRKYIQEQGASWDGPGIVCHEGYHHWFVDNEIVMAARQRGVWTMALGSVVEHLHPYWQKSEMDAVYELGQENVQDDKQEYERRCQQYSQS
jgi:hypothetical protein